VCPNYGVIINRYRIAAATFFNELARSAVVNGASRPHTTLRVAHAVTVNSTLWLVEIEQLHFEAESGARRDIRR
jgi:hypothetical protein